jgi:hypothetical protein
MDSARLKSVSLVLCFITFVSCGWWGDERRAINDRLREFTEHVNSPETQGVGTLGRAAELGGFFTEDVVVELGEGTTPIAGREMLMAMAVRLQPRLSAFTVSFVDENIQLAADRQSADVTLTAAFIRRDPSARQSMDAREFKLAMRRVDGEWKMARVTAIDTLK